MRWQILVFILGAWGLMGFYAGIRVSQEKLRQEYIEQINHLKRKNKKLRTENAFNEKYFGKICQEKN